MAVGTDAENLHVDAARGLDRRVVGGAGARDLLAVLERGAVEHVAGHVDLGRVEPQGLDDRAVDGRVVGLRVGQRQADVLVQCEALHLGDVDRLLLDDLGERLVGGQRAGAGGESQHRVRLGLDEVRHRASVQLSGLLLVLDDDDFCHGVFLSDLDVRP